jgi:phosphopantothenoylcysteine synthetase/decarboxylase
MHKLLYVIACGAPPAAELPGFVSWAQQQGWRVCVIATPYGSKFVDAARLAGLTGYPVRQDYKQPDEPDVLPFPPDAYVVAPATFNTVNKWASGISDTLALGLLNEGLLAGQPIIAVPFPNQALARHPAFQRSVSFLRDCGVQVIFDPQAYPLPSADRAGAGRAGAGRDGAGRDGAGRDSADGGGAGQELFPWPALRDALAAAAGPG